MPAGNLFRPLKVRDFRLLWGGQTVSLLGDGIFVVALAWQTIHLSSSPAARTAPFASATTAWRK